MQQINGTLFEATTIRDVMVCWLAWVSICITEGYSVQGPETFHTLFEIVSCFGNVGLSLGEKLTQLFS